MIMILERRAVLCAVGLHSDCYCPAASFCQVFNELPSTYSQPLVALIICGSPPVSEALITLFQDRKDT
jgi:hypothetical protein